MMFLGIDQSDARERHRRHRATSSRVGNHESRRRSDGNLADTRKPRKCPCDGRLDRGGARSLARLARGSNETALTPPSQPTSKSARLRTSSNSDGTRRRRSCSRGMPRTGFLGSGRPMSMSPRARLGIRTGDLDEARRYLETRQVVGHQRGRDVPHRLLHTRYRDRPLGWRSERRHWPSPMRGSIGSSKQTTLSSSAISRSTPRTPLPTWQSGRRARTIRLGSQSPSARHAM